MTGQASQAVGAAIQLLVNLACIVVASAATLYVQRAIWRRITSRPTVRR